MFLNFIIYNIYSLYLHDFLKKTFIWNIKYLNFFFWLIRVNPGWPMKPRTRPLSRVNPRAGFKNYASAHIALGLHWAWTMPAPHLGTPDAWVLPLNPRGMGSASGPKINGSSVMTKLLLGPPSRPKVLGL